jgi:hypothetical protein
VTKFIYLEIILANENWTDGLEVDEIWRMLASV